MPLTALLLLVPLAAPPAQVGVQDVAAAIPARPLPNVAVLLWDDVSEFDLNEIDTPNFDALASQGVRFTRAYTHAWCAPTRDSLMSGLWRSAYRGGICGEAPSASPVVPYEWPDTSIASTFRHRGYSTNLVGKWHLGLMSPSLDPLRAPNYRGFDRWLQGVSSGGTCFGTRVVEDGVLVRWSGQETMRHRDAFIRAYDDAVAASKPFFGVAAFTDAHKLWRHSSLDPQPPPPLYVTDRQNFESEVRGLDSALGSIVEALGPDTWIVVLGDNGTPEEVAPNPNRAKRSVFERGIRVPFLVLGPGIVPGECDSPVSVVDVYASLMAALKWDTPYELDGQNFTPALWGRPLPRTWVYAENPTRQSHAVIEKRWKLMRRSSAGDELYDLRKDPLEKNPLPPSGVHYDRLVAILDDILS